MNDWVHEIYAGGNDTSPDASLKNETSVNTVVV